ncbi:unnamed protein product [Staurois parvus]|uniref:Uncharacterized protein n=1 Tax=Staurois parvus TaxID=386267 RepID=A0ABN9GNZ6_9NEOB|nr:unnamed protein product [Staurois parvus]
MSLLRRGRQIPIRAGWTDDRSRSERDGMGDMLGVSEVRLAGSGYRCGQRGTGGVSGEWSGSQARISR